MYYVRDALTLGTIAWTLFIGRPSRFGGSRPSILQTASQSSLEVSLVLRPASSVSSQGHHAYPLGKLLVRGVQFLVAKSHSAILIDIIACHPLCAIPLLVWSCPRLNQLAAIFPLKELMEGNG